VALGLFQAARQVGDVGSGDEAAHFAKGHNQAAPVSRRHLRGERFAALKHRLGALPIHALAGLVDREDEVAILVFGLDDHDRNLVARLNAGGQVTRAVQVGTRHDAVAFQTDVNDGPLRVYVQDGAGQHFAALNLGHGQRLFKQLGEF
jgi:hypothetical protein